MAGRSPATIKLYSYHLVPFFYQVCRPVPEITDRDIIMYLYTLKKSNHRLGNRSLEHIRLILSSFFSWCHDNGYVRQNPMSVIQPIKFEQKEISPIDDEAFERIRTSITDKRDKAVFEVLYSTGCRISELVGLKLDDIDLKEREVHLFGKGQKHRISFLSVRAVVALKEYLEIRPECDCKSLFLTSRRPYKQLSIEGVRNRLTPIGISIGVDGSLHPHRIRHQFATEWVDKGLPVTELQQILGHEKLSTTQLYYTQSKARTKADHQRFIA